MRPDEFKTKVNHAMSGPPDFQRLWKLMDESNSPTMEMKLYREEGDEKPFRAIILVNGEQDVAEILALLEKRHV